MKREFKNDIFISSPEGLVPNFQIFWESFVKFNNQDELIFGEECDDTKFTSLRYVTKNNNYDHINCSGVSMSSGQIVLDQLHRNQCMLQFSDSLRMVVILDLKIVYL